MAIRKPKPKVIYSTQPRFKLEPYIGMNSRTTCPSCGHRHKFSHFIDVTTGDRIGDDFGRCERVESCGYIKSPTGNDIKGLSLEVSTNDVIEKFRTKDITNLIDSKYVIKSLDSDIDFLSVFLYKIFDKDNVTKVLKRYRVGSNDKWGRGSTVFWQIDRDYDIRTGKIMLYDPENGKRVKEPYSHITWVHTPLKDNDFGDNTDYCLTQCFFGEHLLNNEEITTFNVVESEKTAIICSVYRPNTYWIATGGIQNINEERLLPFKGKELIFYPDKGKAFKLWEEKLKPFKKDYNIKINDYLENIDTLNEGDDIGDLLILKQIKKNETV